MFPKHLYRLRSKDVNYIVKRKNAVFSQDFTISWIEQYANKKFHQYSVNVGAVFHKSSVVRHQMKRIVLRAIASCFPPTQLLQGRYYKIFFSLNKKNIADLQQRFATQSRAELYAFLQKSMSASILILQKKLSQKSL